MTFSSLLKFLYSFERSEWIFCVVFSCDSRQWWGILAPLGRGDSTAIIYISSVHSGPRISSTLHGCPAFFYGLLCHILKFYFQDKPHVQQNFLSHSECDLRLLVVSKSTATKKCTTKNIFMFLFSIKLLLHDMFKNHRFLKKRKQEFMDNVILVFLHGNPITWGSYWSGE